MKDKITIGEKYGPAMEIQTQAEADKYFEECVLHTMSHGKSRSEAEDVERSNLGYYAGYYDTATRVRVEKLFRCSHPIFGSVVPTPAECIQAGIETAVRSQPN